jgi:PadR family transcriptional regulator, regulatory protein AphA
MVSTPALTTTQHLILTTIAWRGPCTPYELKDYFQRVVRTLVDVPHTMLYTEPPKLAALGLVHEEREETGRRRKTYSITEAGMEVVRAWLASPPSRDPSTEDEAIMKLVYSVFSTPAAVRDLARHQVAFYEARITAIEEALPTSDHDARRRRYLRTGARLAYEQAKVLREFWLDVEQDPDRKAESKRRGV